MRILVVTVETGKRRLWQQPSSPPTPLLLLLLFLSLFFLSPLWLLSPSGLVLLSKSADRDVDSSAVMRRREGKSRGRTGGNHSGDDLIIFIFDWTFYSFLSLVIARMMIRAVMKITAVFWDWVITGNAPPPTSKSSSSSPPRAATPPPPPPLMQLSSIHPVYTRQGCLVPFWGAWLPARGAPKWTAGVWSSWRIINKR